MAGLRGESGSGSGFNIPIGMKQHSSALILRGFIAPLELDGSINRDALEAYIEQVLTPSYDMVTSSSWTIFSATKTRGLFNRSGRPKPSCTISHLYNPDFNPIKTAFAKNKAILRKVAKRSVGGL